VVHDGDGVFFVGNSFFGWENRPLPEWVAGLGRAASPPVRMTVGSDIVFGNIPLRVFLTHQATRDALASHRYKVFVLQGEDYEPVDHKAAFHQAVRDFNRAIVAAGGKTVLFMTWEFHFRRFIDELAASYDEIGRELNIPVIPAGLVYRDAESLHPRQTDPFWLYSGDIHPNAKGSAVNTYVTFALLTGINPRGVNFVAPNNTNPDAAMRQLSDMAWSRVRPRLLLEGGDPESAEPR
jgi:hypothetical protein